jgi:hypothetical protein
MNLFTIEADGRPVAVMAAEDLADAEAIAGSKALKSDMMLYETVGGPVWSGETPLFVREAFDEEAETWRDEWQEAEEEGEVGPGDEEGWLVFLVPVTEPDEDE